MLRTFLCNLARSCGDAYYSNAVVLYVGAQPLLEYFNRSGTVEFWP
jgi:hypothetical protein